ncbi:TPA: glutamate--cysteine ligase [Legionella pneumophila]|uniref:Glutamate--cysteine ligase n=1 Tax=Legionella pneumophila subsp. pneumophila TaxID=91891 RepID=A0A3A6UEL4_LEGPN|nr:glutamate--cysteine ligase [Legionella pneumophila]ERH45858.1 glutamate--cysteine ligase [Legionella pneumophila str. Leg01/11]ERI49042.1 glutamate--cysteine ligase [Legionella pneumophila str. Leg01/20]ANN95856.1 glutamate--cysteine ligase [Legionella pneumophila]ERB41022.1 glutamate--cysteine ligase [Legionella pneumophila str. 121004]MCW8392082.1 glutamate--cysteine ligase [Legionella pneumophila]
MNKHEIPVPHLTTAHSGPLYHVEKIILNKLAEIESWFRKKWQETPAPLTSSVDLRHAGFKLAPVDTNLFPAGFNNLNPEFLPLCIQAAQSALIEYIPDCTKILLLPESHTRNKYYLQSLNVLKTIFVKAGFIVRIGSLDPDIKEPTEIILEQGETLLIEPLQRQGDKVGLDNFSPCLLLLNNDLSSGVPEILQDVQQRIRPTAKLGWASRLKSSHFQFFEEVAIEFAELVGIDPWLINPYFSAIEGVDFMAQEGIEILAQEVDKILSLINDKYTTYGIENKPFAVVKADNGTYGMSVMMVHNGDEIRQLNRKQRTRMSTSKGSRKVDRVIIQEGVYTFETMPDGSVAEPVVYMIGQFVVGGFYRVHKGRGIDENLNAPGMHFEPLAFAQACNMPCDDLKVVDCPNRFYVYGVIARLAALAAAREIAAIGGE